METINLALVIVAIAIGVTALGLAIYSITSRQE